MIVIILLMLFITSKIDKEGETNSRNKICTNFRYIQ